MGGGVVSVGVTTWIGSAVAGGPKLMEYLKYDLADVHKSLY
jgi:hypothetical protein